MEEMRLQMPKSEDKNRLVVSLIRISDDKLARIKDEIVDESDLQSSTMNMDPKKPGRSPMVMYIGQLYRERERKADADKPDSNQKAARPRVLPPPHYDHWNLDHVPLKCSQCEFHSTHETVKRHYKKEHIRIFPTAFDLEAKHKKKKYTVFMCPSSGCGFTTYWREVINHHTKGHRFNRHEIDGLIFKVFGDKTPGNTG